MERPDRRRGEARHGLRQIANGERTDVRLYEQIYPIGVVTTQSGDARFLYEKMHLQGTESSSCVGPEGPGPCMWGPPSGTSTGQLLIGWINADHSGGHASVAESIAAVSGAVALDAIGTIHVAVHDGFGTVPRYLQIGP